MLAALEEGRGPCWYSLIDKVYRPAMLQWAWEQVRAKRGATGVDGQSVAAFAARAERYLEELCDALRAGTYQPHAIRRHYIPKDGSNAYRPRGIPTVKDRIVQTALKYVLEPIWEARVHPRSYGGRPGRRCCDALREVERLLHEGDVWAVDADITAYFDSSNTEQLYQDVQQVVADTAVLRLIAADLQQGVVEARTEWTPEHGTPQGAVISPLWADIYLHPVDEALSRAGYEHVRYADDLVILCRSRDEAEQALQLLTALLAARGLTLHREKTRIVGARGPGGFDVLGYHFERGRK